MLNSKPLCALFFLLVAPASQAARPVSPQARAPIFGEWDGSGLDEKGRKCHLHFRFDVNAREEVVVEKLIVCEGGGVFGAAPQMNYKREGTRISNKEFGECGTIGETDLKIDYLCPELRNPELYPNLDGEVSDTFSVQKDGSLGFVSTDTHSYPKSSMKGNLVRSP